MSRGQNINSLKNLINYAKMFDAKTITYNVVQTIADEGEKIIKKAYESRDWKNRTYNLRDSYVSAVFVNGRLQEDSIRFVGPEMSHRPRNYGEDSQGDSFAVKGRSEAINFMRSYAARHTGEKGVRLVVAAAMFYSSILAMRGYRVLSEFDADLSKIIGKDIKVNTSRYLAAKNTLTVKISGVVRRVDNIAEGGHTFSGFGKK